MEVHPVGNPVRDGRMRGHRGDDLPGGLGRRAVQLVLGLHDPREYAHVETGERFARPSGVLERFPGDFQKQPLLRVQQFGLPRSDMEKGGVETVHSIEEAAPMAVAAASPALVGVEIPAMVPSLLGNRFDAVPAALEIFPKLLDRPRFRVAPGEADNRDVAGCGNAPSSKKRLRRALVVPPADIFRSSPFLCPRLAFRLGGQAAGVVLGDPTGQVAEVGVLIEERLGQWAEILLHIPDHCPNPDGVRAKRFKGEVDFCIVRGQAEMFGEKPSQVGAGRLFDCRGTGGRALGGCFGRLSGGFTPGYREALQDLFSVAAQDHDLLAPRAHRRLERHYAGPAFERLEPHVFPHPPARVGWDVHSSGVPQRPVDRDAGAGALAEAAKVFPPSGEMVQETVRVGVVGLSGVSEDRCDRRKKDEKVERIVPRQFVQVHSSPRLGPDDRFHLLPRLVAYEAVPQLARAVDDAADFPEAFPHGVEGLFQLRPGGDVRLDVQGPRAGALDAAELLLPGGVKRRTSDQRHVRMTLSGEIISEGEPKSAHAPSDDDGAIVREGKGGFRAVLHFHQRALPPGRRALDGRVSVPSRQQFAPDDFADFVV